MSRLAVSCLLACAAIAQQGIPSDEARLQTGAYWPRSDLVLRAETKSVEVGVVVRDERGHPVGGLTKDDFQIEDSGKKADITAFRADVAQPAIAAQGTGSASGQSVTPPTSATPTNARRYIGLFFDDFSMGPGEIMQARIAGKRFVKQALADGELVAVFSMSKPLLQRFTNDAAQLNAAIDKVVPSQRTGAGADTCPTFTPYEAYLVANNDLNELDVKLEEYARCSPGLTRMPRPNSRPNPTSGAPKVVAEIASSVWEQLWYNSRTTLLSIGAFVEYMAKLPGSRVLVVASSGFLTGTLEQELDEVEEQARRRDVVINSLDARGLYTDEALDVSQRVPKGASFRTMIRAEDNAPKGKAAAENVLYSLAASTGGLFFQNNNDLNLGFEELGLSPRYSYSIGFTPHGEPDNQYHRISVQLKSRQGRTVQTRPGYFYAIRKPTDNTQRPIDREILSDRILSEMPGTVTATPAKTDDGAAAMRLVIHLDLQKMRFTMQKGVRHQKVTWIAALFDNGTFLIGRESSVDFELKDATFRSLQNGFEAELLLPVPDGKYRLRNVIQEAVGGKFTATDQVVDVR